MSCQRRKGLPRAPHRAWGPRRLCVQELRCTTGTRRSARVCHKVSATKCNEGTPRIATRAARRANTAPSGTPPACTIETSCRRASFAVSIAVSTACSTASTIGDATPSASIIDTAISRACSLAELLRLSSLPRPPCGFCPHFSPANSTPPTAPRRRSESLWPARRYGYRARGAWGNGGCGRWRRQGWWGGRRTDRVTSDDGNTKCRGFLLADRVTIHHRHPLADLHDPVADELLELLHDVRILLVRLWRDRHTAGESTDAEQQRALRRAADQQSARNPCLEIPRLMRLVPARREQQTAVVVRTCAAFGSVWKSFSTCLMIGSMRMFCRKTERGRTRQQTTRAL